jgi:hypothetical protein
MTRTDIDQKRLNPAAFYGDPEKVLEDAGLSRDEKIEILREWHYDAMRLQESAGENMAGGEEDRLRAVSNALLKLGVSPARESDPRPAPARSSPLRTVHRFVAKAMEPFRTKGGH